MDTHCLLREVNFYGDVLPLTMIENKAYIAIRPISQFLGLTWSSQCTRIKRDEVLSRHILNIPMRSADGKQHPMMCLQLEFLPGWLFGITPSRAKPELMLKLMRYREECFQTLWREYQHNLKQAFYLQEINETSSASPFYLSHFQIVERVRAQLARAKDMGLPARLTVEQWLSTMDYFQWKCAYCQERAGIIIEHFIPLILGGGTTVNNCVPSCYPCNAKKKDKHPSTITEIASDVLARVQFYLDRVA